MTIHKILKPGGLFLADEFAREAMDVQTAKFLYGRMDDLEAAGKFHSSSKWPASEDIKHDYLKRYCNCSLSFSLCILSTFMIFFLFDLLFSFV